MANINSNEMKNVVETYIIEETQELIYDDARLEEWNRMVEELGLEGQTAIVKPAKSPVPFLHMPPALVNTFKTLCPAKRDVEKYNLTPIPIEVLSLVALSKKEEYFEKIEIWYDDKNPDPACIGVRYNTFYSRNQKGNIATAYPTKDAAKMEMLANGVDGEPYPAGEIRYLIARWGDEKRSFEDLKARARSRYIVEKGSEYKKTIKDAERQLADIEIKADELFLSEKPSEWLF